MTYNCSRCSTELNEPIVDNADYVVSDDFVEEEETEVHYALVHTDRTEKRVKHLADQTGREFHELAANMARPDAPEQTVLTVGTERIENDDGTFVETAKKKEFDFSIDETEFDRKEVDTPEVIKDDDVAYVKTVTEMRPVQKTALICLDCYKEDHDDVIWGPDSE